MEVGSAAALYAGSVLVKKTFEAVAQRSLSSLFTRLHVRFRGQIESQLQVLEKELESRLQVLSLPVDMCVQYVLHGNTALQGALDMALRVINDIVSFQEELEAQTYNESIVKTSQADAVSRLKGFMTRLDSILPYLSMAVNAVSLLRVADSGLSPSRLMESSHLIRTANSRQGSVTSLRARVYKYETKLTLPRWQEKMMKCSVSLRQTSSLESNEFELSITNEEESEPGDLPTSIRIPVSDITAVGSSTLHVLGLGQHELEAVLLVDTLVPSGTSEVSKDGTASTSLQEVNHYAFQCIEDTSDVPNEVNQQDDSSDHDGDSSHDSQEGDAQELESNFGSKVYKLGMLEYALRLCMLQVKEEKEHWLLSDERIRLFFVDPRYISEPMGIIQKTRSGSGKIPSGFRTPTPGKGAPVRQSRTSAGITKVASRIPNSRTNISELFYDLRLDSPGSSGAS
ncbi:hypothetical protein M758_3G223400 [Ceratodon purpureus]|nr:hypothetical protein M758_3G223400 [Ceratodon purpureus]